jgi:RNA polymerase sigma factor (sigma-70 family)
MAGSRTKFGGPPNQMDSNGVVQGMEVAMDESASLSSAEPSLTGAVSGDFADRVQPHVLRMTRLARRLVAADSAEDVVQEALMRAWAKRHQFDPRRGSLSSWLLAITANQAYKSRRRRSWGVMKHSIADQTQPPEERLDLQRSLQALPARQRLAVDCYYFAGLSVAETAAVMGCSAGTVKSTLSDARKTIRTMMR